MRSLVRVLFASVLITPLFAGAARAAELTLDDCISLALKNRANIIAARGTQELAKAGRQAALGAFLPKLSTTYEYDKTQLWKRYGTYQVPVVDTTVLGSGDTLFITSGKTMKGKLPDATSTAKSWDVSGDVTIPLPGSWLTYEAARLDYERSRLDVLTSEQDLILSVKGAYYAYLAAVQGATVQDEAVKRSEEQLKLIQSKFDLGSAAMSDVLKQKVQYGNDRLNQLQATNAVINAKSDLAYTIGIDPREERDFSSKYDVREYEGTLQDAISFGLAHKPSLLSGQRSVDAAKRRECLAKSGYLPTFTPFANYGYSWTPDARELGLTYGFRLSLNIFDGFKREQGVTQARVARIDAEANLADQRNNVSSRIRTAYLNIGQLKEQKNVSNENVAAATEDLKITQEKYKLGAATILDLLNAQVSLKQAEVALIKVGFDLNLAVANLENAMGKM